MTTGDILDFIDVGIVIIGDGLEIIDSNKFSRDYLVNDSKFELKNCAQSEHEKVYSKICAVRESQNSEVVEIHLSNEEVLEMKIDFFKDEESNKIIISFSNITEKIIKKAYLDNALSSSKLVWWEWDISRDEFTVHPGDMCILEYPFEECQKISSETWFKMVHSEDVKKVREALDNTLSGIADVWSVEHRFINRRGDWVWVLNTGRIILRDKQGKPSYMTGSTQLINDKKLLETKNSFLLNKARSVVRLKKNFLCAISHELKTPLNPIVGAFQLIESLESKDEVQKLCAMGKESLIKLDAMIQDILDYTEILSGGLIFENNSFFINELIDEIWNDFEDAFYKKGLNLIIESMPSIEITTDKKLLKKAISNIVGNALKFTQSGGCKVGIKTSGDFVRIVITDSGEGLPIDEIDEVFSEFYQVDGGYTRKHDGIGLGLPITKAIVNSLGGEIKVETSLNGCSFEISLPKLHKDCSKEEELSIRYTLVIEENEADRTILKKYLSSVSETVDFAPDLTVAREMIQGNKYDLVISDFLLPDGDALDFMSELDKGTSPVIIYTSDDSEIDIERIDTSYVKAVLSKPSSWANFKQVVKRALE